MPHPRGPFGLQVDVVSLEGNQFTPAERAVRIEENKRPPPIRERLDDIGYLLRREDPDRRAVGLRSLDPCCRVS